MKKILIIGAGRGGTGMLSLVSHYPEAKVIGIADTDTNAQGLIAAKQLGIPTSQNYRDFLDREDIDLIMNLTHDNSLTDEIRKLKPNIDVLGGMSAKFLWNIAVNHRKREEEKSQLAERLKSTNEQLVEAMEYQKNILAHSPDMIITTDKDFKTILQFNKGAETMLGYSYSEMVGRSAATLYADPNERDNIIRKLNEANSLSNYETRLICKNDKLLDIILTISFLFNGKGEKIGTVGISKDITENKKLETKLKETNLELESFVYTVSHDLKAPLRAIYGFSGFLMDDYYNLLDEDGKHFLRRIREGAQMMKTLIDDLLELSRVGRSAIVFKSEDSRTLISKAIEANQYQLDEKKGVINVEGTLPIIICDRVRIIQLFSNLINNSIKYSKNDEPPKIEIGCREDQNEWIFYVKDNGIGIEEEYREKIFEIFQRLHKAEEFEGTGIGLTIIKKIAEIHGGRAWVESEAGTGSTFFISLKKTLTKN